MNEDTTIIKKQDLDVTLGSHFSGISIRAWLALMVVGTICIIQVAFAIRAIYVGDYNYMMDGQFWMIGSSVIVYFFAEKKQTTNTTTV